MPAAAHNFHLFRNRKTPAIVCTYTHTLQVTSNATHFSFPELMLTRQWTYWLTYCRSINPQASNTTYLVVAFPLFNFNLGRSASYKHHDVFACTIWSAEQGGLLCGWALSYHDMHSMKKTVALQGLVSNILHLEIGFLSTRAWATLGLKHRICWQFA